jgi:hypothetical protein
VNEVLEGLRLYFDRALGTILLYRFERQQYADVRDRYPGIAMSQIYGAEHLLRLFGMLSRMLLSLLTIHSAITHAYCPYNHGSTVCLDLERTFEPDRHVNITR